MEHIIQKIHALARYHDNVSPDLIKAKDIKLGLRNSDGTGVVVGITSKGTVFGFKRIPSEDGKGEVVLPAPGRLTYCGYNAIDLARKIQAEGRFGFEEVAYLLLTGELPNREDLKIFSELLSKGRSLNKVERGIITQEAENENQMFALHSVISHLSRCDSNPVSLELKDVIMTCINLIAKFPTVVAYNHKVSRYRQGGSLRIIPPDPDLSMAENFLYMLTGTRPHRDEAMLFRPVPHAACRAWRGKQLHLHGAHCFIQRRQHLYGHLLGHRFLKRPSPWRRQRGGHEDDEGCEKTCEELGRPQSSEKVSDQDPRR